MINGSCMLTIALVVLVLTNPAAAECSTGDGCAQQAVKRVAESLGERDGGGKGESGVDEVQTSFVRLRERCGSSNTASGDCAVFFTQPDQQPYATRELINGQRGDGGSARSRSGSPDNGGGEKRPKDEDKMSRCESVFASF